MPGMVILGDPNRKYQLQQQSIDTQRDLANSQIQDAVIKRGLLPDQVAAENYARRGAGFAAFAQGNKTNLDAKLMPDVVNSEIALRGAQGHNLNSTANATDTSARLAPALATSEIGLRGAQMGQADALGNFSRMQSNVLGRTNFAPAPPAFGMGAFGQISGQQPLLTGNAAGNSNVHANPALAIGHALGYVPAAQHPLAKIAGNAAGNADIQPMGEEMGFAAGGPVPGQGDGTQDMVDSKLAPGEAVLNKAAAEFLGRDLIDRINQAGAIAMGLSQKPNQPTAQPAGQPGIPVGPGDAGAPSMPGNAAGNKMIKGKAPGKPAGKPAQKAAPGKAPPQRGGQGKPTSKPAGKPAAGKKAGGAPMPDMTQLIAQMMGGAGGMPQQ